MPEPGDSDWPKFSYTNVYVKDTVWWNLNKPFPNYLIASFLKQALVHIPSHENSFSCEMNFHVNSEMGYLSTRVQLVSIVLSTQGSLYYIKFIFLSWRQTEVNIKPLRKLSDLKSTLSLKSIWYKLKLIKTNPFNRKQKMTKTWYFPKWTHCCYELRKAEC